MLLEFEQRLHYTNQEQIPIKDIAEALIALENIIKNTRPVLEALGHGAIISSIQPDLRELKRGSLLETIVTRLVFKNQQQFEEFLSDTRIFLLEKLKNPAFTSIVVSCALFGAGYAIYDIGKNDSLDMKEKGIIVENNLNSVIQVGAGSINIGPEELKTILESTINRKDAAKNAVKLIKPAKGTRGASIIFDEQHEIIIDDKVVSITPEKYTEVKPEDIQEEFESLNISIVATDKEKNTQGWAARVPEFNDKRIRLYLEPQISSSVLFEKRDLIVRATVQKRLKDDNYEPHLIIIKEIIEP